MRFFGGVAIATALALAGCSKPAADNSAASVETPPVAKPISFSSLKGDAVRGKTLFLQCQICHSLEPGKNMIGPTLHGIVGSKAGDVPGFSFSTAMKDSKIVWTGEQLDSFLQSPQAKVPGTRMSYGGMPDPQSRADVIAFLATQK